MFQGNAEEAINHYISLFEQSEVKDITYYGLNEEGIEGKVRQAVFTLKGQEYMCIDSNIEHSFTFTPAFSLFVVCDTEDEVEMLFKGLSEGGSVLMPLAKYTFSNKFCWIADKFGVSWQLSS